MKYIILLLLSLNSFATFAEDGLIIQFTIKESNIVNHTKRSYTNAILMKFNETAKFEFKNLYNIKFTTHPTNDKTNLVITLHDWMEGKPYYVGAKSVDFKVGSTIDIVLEKYGRKYKINLDTSYGKLP